MPDCFLNNFYDETLPGLTRKRQLEPTSSPVTKKHTTTTLYQPLEAGT